MLKNAILFGFLLCFTSPVLAQTSDPDFDSILSSTHSDDFKDKVLAFVEAHPGTPEALFLRAIAMENARKSVQLYNQLVTDYPNSGLADRAIYRIAQYYFSRGLYVAARREFLRVLEDQSNSGLAGDATYFAAACLCASGQMETCRSELRNFLNLYPDSELSDLAKEDLGELKEIIGNGVRERSIEKVKGEFSLQVGAFSVAENAQRLQSYFEKLGLQAEVVQRTQDNEKLFLVWVGSYASKEAASLAGENLKRDYGKPYRIVERNTVLGKK